MAPIISKIQYISQGKNPEEHLKNIENVCQSGIHWVQLRMKNTDEKIFLKTAKSAQKICKEHRCVFIVNDNIKIAKYLNADGLHLGQKDISIQKARDILGIQKIIGATANSLVEIEKLPLKKINYIGLGPFAFTKTKKNLAPILGIKGYEKIVPLVKNIPLIAVGGIAEQDIKPILKTGIYGIAVSSLFSKKADLIGKIKEVVLKEVL